MARPRVPAVDYLLLGHVCLDLTPEGETPGGTVLFAGRAAVALGLRTAVVTSAPDPERVRTALPGAEVDVQPAGQWTRFRNVYGDGQRTQTSPSQGPRIDPARIAPAWLANAKIVHYAPVAQEIAPLPSAWRPGRVSGLTAQGLARRFEPDGRITYQEPALTETQLQALDAIVVSEEDIQGDGSLAERWARSVAVVAVTRGEAGATLWASGQRRGVPAYPVATDDPTGAGDLFATMLFVSLGAGLPAMEAADRAARFAADVLQARGRGAEAVAAAIAGYRVVTGPPATGYNPAGAGRRERGSE